MTPEERRKKDLEISSMLDNESLPLFGKKDREKADALRAQYNIPVGRGATQEQLENWAKEIGYVQTRNGRQAVKAKAGGGFEIIPAQLYSYYIHDYLPKQVAEATTPPAGGAVTQEQINNANSAATGIEQSAKLAAQVAATKQQEELNRQSIASNAAVKEEVRKSEEEIKKLEQPQQQKVKSALESIASSELALLNQRFNTSQQALENQTNSEKATDAAQRTNVRQMNNASSYNLDLLQRTASNLFGKDAVMEQVIDEDGNPTGELKEKKGAGWLKGLALTESALNALAQAAPKISRGPNGITWESKSPSEIVGTNFGKALQEDVEARRDLEKKNREQVAANTAQSAKGAINLIEQKGLNADQTWNQLELSFANKSMDEAAKILSSSFQLSLDQSKMLSQHYLDLSKANQEFNLGQIAADAALIRRLTEINANTQAQKDLLRYTTVENRAEILNFINSTDYSKFLDEANKVRTLNDREKLVQNASLAIAGTQAAAAVVAALVPDIKIGLSEGGKVPELNLTDGGVEVPGPEEETKDTVPAILTPGEYVIKKSDVKLIKNGMGIKVLERIAKDLIKGKDNG